MTSANPSAFCPHEQKKLDSIRDVVSLRGLARVWLCVSLSWIVPTFAPPVLAAPTKKEAATDRDAKRLKEEGDRAMDEARPADALAAYEKSYALKAEPALLYNQARAHMALTNYAKTLEFLQRFEREAPDSLKAKVPGLAALVSEVKGKLHKLTIKVDVAGAQIRLRDATIGQSPLEPGMLVNAGAATLEVRAAGYKLVHQELTLVGDGESTIDLKLERVDVSGTVVLRSPQPGVRVSVQGKPRGALPLELSLTEGTYPIRLSKEGYESLDTSVVVVAGERRERNLTLAKKPALYTRWWFWTGIGVIAAGTAVTVIALTTERAPDSGTIAPGQLANGLSF